MPASVRWVGAPEARFWRAGPGPSRRDVREPGERLDRVVEARTFLTRLLAEPGWLILGPGKSGYSDTAD